MSGRTSGILLHVTSLPSRYGIGDLGPEAFRFAEFLSRGRQGVWQLLPVNPTRLSDGNSPYSSASVFAGSPLLISPDRLHRDGYLSRSAIAEVPRFPKGRVDYPRVTRFKEQLLETAYRNFLRMKDKSGFDQFCGEQGHWLEDYALFAALSRQFKGRPWDEWPAPLAGRDREELDRWRKRLSEELEKVRFRQYLFFRQWNELKDELRRRGVRTMGDVSFYVHYNSADVWAHRGLFKLGESGKPLSVAGVPPDYFSHTGQLWGNPIYRWDVMKRSGYAWWISRITQNLNLFDLVRLDHFRGFAGYWEVPAGARTAINGKWVPGPGADFFNRLKDRYPDLPLIAEDLGTITPDVLALRDRFRLPGMRILTFAFDSDSGGNPYLPHNLIPNCVAYTGTHDNNTLVGWLFGTNRFSAVSMKRVRSERERALRYLGTGRVSRKTVHLEFIRLLMMSVADTVVIPMQDWLGLGESARMNRPSFGDGNWEWRLSGGADRKALADRIARMASVYGRGG
jgi:4-alpha-glucanotransferase